jgi:hypothetical protein
LGTFNVFIIVEISTSIPIADSTKPVYAEVVSVPSVAASFPSFSLGAAATGIIGMFWPNRVKPNR